VEDIDAPLPEDDDESTFAEVADPDMQDDVDDYYKLPF
jgi:hypothetical protein